MIELSMDTKRKNGFTLFELLVSISIIGILVAIASVSYTAAQKKARDARRQEDISLIQKAAEQYYSANSYVYPANSSVSWNGSLLTFPTDPRPDAATDFQYTYVVSGAGFCVCAKLEDTAGGNSQTRACTAFGSGAGYGYYCLPNQQ